MSLLIKGMKMPISCDECRIMVFEDTNCLQELFCGCPIVFKAHPQGEGKRPDYCPLVELPPHGRLIDADALRQTMYHEAFETDSPMQKWDSGCWIRYKMFENAEETAPTIIPADKDNDVLGKEEGE